MADNKSREVVVDYYGNYYEIISESDEGFTLGLRGEDGIESYDTLTRKEVEELRALTRQKRFVELDRAVQDAEDAKRAFLDDHPELRYEVVADKLQFFGAKTEQSAKRIGKALALKIDVDVSDAITGLKAVQREAKEATKALREVEAQSVGDVFTQEVAKMRLVDEFKMPESIADDCVAGLNTAAISAVLGFLSRYGAFLTRPNIDHAFPLSEFTTGDLTAELAKRDGVTDYFINPHGAHAELYIRDADTGAKHVIDGPARILVNVD